MAETQGSSVNMSYGDSAILDNSGSDSTVVILFVLWGIFLPLVAAMGLVGNILTIIVLWRREMQSTTILYLRALVVTDTGILIGTVITLSPLSCANYLHGETLDYFKYNVYPVLYAPGYYLIMTLQQCNVWITVSVSIERYIAICQPFRAPRLLTRRKTLVVLASIVILSLIYNMPHLFASTFVNCPAPELTTSPVDFGNNYSTSASPPLQPPAYLPSTSTTPPELFSLTTSTSSSLSLSSSSPLSPPPSCLQVATTEFGTTEFYKKYRTIMYSIIIYVIPFLALVILNSFLIRELMLMQRRRAGTNIHEENEANLSMVLVLIVLVFILCQTPGLISQFDVISIDVFFVWLAVSNLLFATNSAVNFLIYTAFGRKFRRVLLRVFRHIYRRGRKLSHAGSYRGATNFSSNDYELTAVADARGSSQRSCKLYENKDAKYSPGRDSIPLTTVDEQWSEGENGLLCNGGTNGRVYMNSETNLGVNGSQH